MFLMSVRFIRKNQWRESISSGFLLLSLSLEKENDVALKAEWTTILILAVIFSCQVC